MSYFKRRSRSVPSTAILVPIQYLDMMGHDTHIIYEHFELDREAIGKPMSRMDATEAHRINVWIADYFEQPFLHVSAALHAPMGSFNITDYVALSAPTLRQGFTRLGDFTAILLQGMRLVFDDTSRGDVTMQLVDNTNMMLDYEREATLSAIAQRANIMTESAQCVRALHLKRITGSRALLESVLPFDLVVDPAGFDGLVLDRACWDAPSRHANTNLWTLIQELARSYMPTEALLIDQVRSIIATALPEMTHSIDHTAGELGMSPRTLQRLLKKEHTSYSELLDQVRQSTARRLITTPSLNMDELASELGFCEQSSMTRAFKRWFGKTPSQMRAGTTS